MKEMPLQAGRHHFLTALRVLQGMVVECNIEGYLDKNNQLLTNFANVCKIRYRISVVSDDIKTKTRNRKMSKTRSEPKLESVSTIEKTPRKRKKIFSVVFMPTLACNCRCSHCFEELAEGNAEDHNWELHFTEMRRLAETLKCNTLKVYWQGGEVLCLHPDTVQCALDIGAAVFKDSDITLEHHLQTNLLLYETSRWKEVISNFFLGSISSSIDLPNLFRLTPTLGVDEYNRAWLKKKDMAERDGFTVSVVSLPNHKTLELGAERFYRFFRDEALLKNVQVNFPFPGNSGLEPLDLKKLAGFMTDLYKIWVASGRDLNLSPFRAMEDRLLRGRGALPCCWTYSCASILLSIGPNGGVGQCDCWVATYSDHNFGTTDQPVEQLLDSDQRQPFLNRPLKLMRDTKCGECKFWGICFGGCPIRAFAFTGNLMDVDHYCPVYYEMFSIILDQAEHESQLEYEFSEEVEFSSSEKGG